MIRSLTGTPRTKKSFGQHLLTDLHCCERILQFADINKSDDVVEIGAGTGILTRQLLDAGASVTAIEMDRDMIPYLDRLAASSEGRLRVEPTNVLHADWGRIIRSPTVKIVGNLPYNISTRVIREMMPVHDRFHSATVMLQKEVAERILAGPGARDYGYFSVLTDFYFRKRRGFDVPPGAFRPRPKVFSSVLMLIPRQPIPDLPRIEHLDRVLAAAFRAPRKTVFNNLRGLQPKVEQLEQAFQRCGIAPNARPNHLDLEQFLCLARVL